MKKKFFDAKRFTLDNGLKIITIKRNTQITAVHCSINTGSLHESEDERGISHFVEHMLFKGTEKRTNIELNNYLEDIGGEYNAYTDFNSTVYGITALSEELENSLEILSDMLKNSTFPEEEIEREKGVILAEIRTSNDDIEDFSFKKVNSIAFKKSPLRVSTLGEENSVKKFTKEKLLNFYKSNYIPNNCYLSIVSPFNHDDVLKITEKYFNNWIRKDFNRGEIITEKNIEMKKFTYKKEIQQSTIIYLYTFFNLDKREELALKILNHKFGASANSILFRELREERGLAYDVYSDADNSKDVKTLYIYTAVGSENVKESIETINSCIDKIKNRNIIFDEKTINLMKKVIKTAIALTLEDSTDLGNYVLHRAIENKDIHGFEEDLILLDDIKSEDLYNAANKVFNGPTIHVLLPRKSG